MGPPMGASKATSGGNPRMKLHRTSKAAPNAHAVRIPRRLLGARRESIALQFRSMAALAAVLSVIVASGATAADAAACDKVASPLGSDAYPGSTAEPYATFEHLANSLKPGQTGCLRVGRLPGRRQDHARRDRPARRRRHELPGRARHGGGPHPRRRRGEQRRVPAAGPRRPQLATTCRARRVNGDGIVFRDNDVTNHHTTICFLLGSDGYGRARGTVIERNRIHNCGELPPTNHHHGIYVEASDGARITDNWIYDNADRGVQLFPDAQGTYVARNVIDGNGQGVIFSRTSANNVVENNVISNPALRYNIEDWELSGGGNVARRNCVWSTRHAGNPGGIQPGLEVSVVDEPRHEPRLHEPRGEGLQAAAGQPVPELRRDPRSAEQEEGEEAPRPVRLRAEHAVVWPGGHLRLRAKVKSAAARASASRKAVLKVRRGSKWRRVGTMKLHGVRYTAAAAARQGRPRGAPVRQDARAAPLGDAEAARLRARRGPLERRPRAHRQVAVGSRPAHSGASRAAARRRRRPSSALHAREARSAAHARATPSAGSGARRRRGRRRPAATRAAAPRGSARAACRRPRTRRARPPRPRGRRSRRTDRRSCGTGGRAAARTPRARRPARGRAPRRRCSVRCGCEQVCEPISQPASARPAQLLPGHRAQLRLVRAPDPLVDAGPGHRPVATGVVGRHEHRRRQPEPVQDRLRRARARTGTRRRR